MSLENRSRISFFLPSFEGGGAEQNLINILNNINRDNYEIELVLGLKKGIFLDKIPGDILVSDLNGSSFLNVFLGLRRYFISKKPDIFVSTFHRFNFAGLLAKIFSKSKVKFIIIEQTIHSKIHKTSKNIFRKIISYFFLPSLIRIFYPKADAIICVSNSVKNDLYNVLGKSIKLEVIYNPIVDDSIISLSKEPLFEDQYIFEGAYPVIIAVGRLVKAKDYPTLLKAFKRVLDSKKARLLILGEGPEENQLKELVSQLQIYNQVVFAGFKKNPYKYMAHSSLFVLSSIREGFGNVIVQAMACGIPILATNDNSGPGEIINNGVNGLLVDTNNIEALSDAILKILENPDFAKKLSENGLERAKSFSIKESVANYEKVFGRLLNE